MKIVQPSITLLSHTPVPEQLIERAGRTAYKSEMKIDTDSAAAFIRGLTKRGHGSVLEHASASFLWITDRGVTHELVRHRLASYTQESTRYCAYADGIAVIEPPFDTSTNSGGSCREIWLEGVKEAEATYCSLLARGIKPEIARSVLPTCLKTEIVITANFREWRHIISLRAAKTAHPQIRAMAVATGEHLKMIAPNVFFDFESQTI